MTSEETIASFESRYVSPAALRNRAPLLTALADRLPASGTVLELAAGALTHALALSAVHPLLRWLPSEVDPRILGEVSNYLRALAHLKRLPSNLLSPLALDVGAAQWPLVAVEAMYTANLLHISPWESTVGLFHGAGRYLAADGRLLIYGPFRIDGQFTSAGDERFDASLRDRNPSFGIRDLELLQELAAEQGLALQERLAMPANNWLLTFLRTASTPVSAEAPPAADGPAAPVP